MSPSTPRWQAMATSDVFTFAQVANEGVRLLFEPDRIVAHPNLPSRSQLSPPLAPIALPRMPLEMVHRCARWLRELYRNSQSLYCLPLYVDFDSGRWRSPFPSGILWPTGYRIDLGKVPLEQLNDGHPWRLAGTVQSLLFAEQPEDPNAPYALEVPPFDGAHVLLDPRYLLLPRLMLRAGETLHITDPANAILEPPHEFEQAAQRIRWCEADPT